MEEMGSLIFVLKFERLLFQVGAVLFNLKGVYDREICLDWSVVMTLPPSGDYVCI